MRARDPELLRSLALCTAIALGLLYFSQFLPALDGYRYAADEGTYFRQATLIADEGLAGFSSLARSYLANPAEHTAPPPFRVVHIGVAALALHLSPSIRALSLLSLLCHGLSCVVLFALGRKLWGGRTAAAASLLQLVSPLSAGAGLRALADTHFALASLTTLLLFCRFSSGERRMFPWFAAALGYSLLLKESAYFVLPFYVLVLVLWRITGALRVSTRELVVTAAAVPLGALTLSAWLLGGWSVFVATVDVALGLNARTPHAYLAAFGAGPWYEYVVDYLLLSPLTALLALAYVGSVVVGRDTARATALCVAFVAYFFGVFATLPKNPRFAIGLDPLLRLGALAMLEQLLARVSAPRLRLGLGAAALISLMASDVRGFRRFFVEGGVYDPVAFNLLTVERLIPGAATTPAVPPAALPAPRADATAQALREASPEAYLALSVAEYEAKHFDASVRASRAALKLRPDFAPAYNNMGLAYAGLGQWQLAIDAFESALRIAPDFVLARNNLAWIRGEAEKAGAP